MQKPIKIIVKGSGAFGDDAPTVEDLVAQVQDFVSVLHQVESAISESGQEEIVWKVTNLTKNSPLTIEISPYPKDAAVNIDRRVGEVISATSDGIRELTVHGRRPRFFNEKAIDKTTSVFKRVANGLENTVFDFSAFHGVRDVEASRRNVKQSLKEIEKLSSHKAVAYREFGSVEGYISKVELDGFGRPIIWMKARLDGQLIKCVSDDHGLDRIGHFEVAEVLKGLRVNVFGTIQYKDYEKVSYVDVTRVHVFASDDELPNFTEIVSPDFTNGLEASKYLEILRNDG